MSSQKKNHIYILYHFVLLYIINYIICKYIDFLIIIIINKNIFNILEQYKFLKRPIVDFKRSYRNIELLSKLGRYLSTYQLTLTPSC